MPSSRPDGTPTTCIIPRVEFGGVVFDDPTVFVRELTDFLLPDEPPPDQDAENADEHRIMRARQKSAIARLLTDRRMANVYELVLQYARPKGGPGAPTGFRFQVQPGNPSPVNQNTIADWVGYWKNRIPNDPSLLRSVLDIEKYRFQQIEQWTPRDRAWHQYGAILRMLGAVIAFSASDHGDVLTKTSISSSIDHYLQIYRNLSDTVDLMKNSCVRGTHMESVQKAADAAAAVAECLQHELDTLPLPSRKPRVSAPLYSFVEAIADSNKALFGDAIPAVISTLAEVIGVAPRVSRCDVDNILRNMHRR